MKLMEERQLNKPPSEAAGPKHPIKTEKEGKLFMLLEAYIEL
jgi:hypothetical protein